MTYSNNSGYSSDNNNDESSDDNNYSNDSGTDNNNSTDNNYNTDDGTDDAGDNIVVDNVEEYVEEVTENGSILVDASSDEEDYIIDETAFGEVAGQSVVGYESDRPDLADLGVDWDMLSQVQGFKLLDTLACQAEGNHKLEQPTQEELDNLNLQIVADTVKTHPGGWTDGFDKPIVKGENLRGPGRSQSSVFGPCIEFPHEYGWDYRDYDMRYPGENQLTSSVSPVYTIPFGPPVGYGNITHNPSRFHVCNAESWVKAHMEGIKWTWIKREDEGIQEDIAYVTKWHSGPAKTADAAGVFDDASSPFSHTSGPHAKHVSAHAGMVFRFGKWAQKGSTSKKSTFNYVYIGHNNKKGQSTNYDYGVVGASGWLWPHLSDIQSHDTHNNDFNNAWMHAFYGIYRRDASDEEIVEKSDAAKLWAENLKEILSEIVSGVGESTTGGYSTENSYTYIRESGLFDRLKNNRLENKLGAKMILQGVVELFNYNLPQNKGKFEKSHEIVYTPDYLVDFIELKGAITGKDIFNYFAARANNVPDAAMTILGEPLDFDRIAAIKEGIVDDKSFLHKFFLVAFSSKLKAQIRSYTKEEYDFEVKYETGLSLRYSEFLLWNQGDGMFECCERNGGLLINGEIGTNTQGSDYYTHYRCINKFVYDETGEEIDLFKPQRINGAVFLDDDFNDDEEYTRFEKENIYIPEVKGINPNLKAGAETHPSPETAFKTRNIFAYENPSAVNPVILAKVKYENPLYPDAKPKPPKGPFDMQGYKDYYKLPDAAWHLCEVGTYEFNKGDIDYKYEFISTITQTLADETDGNAQPAFEFWFGTSRHDDLLAGAGNKGGWKKLFTLEPSGKAGGSRRNSVIIRPSTVDAQSTPRRFLRIIAVCPKKVGSGFSSKCTNFFKKNVGNIDENPSQDYPNSFGTWRIANTANTHIYDNFKCIIRPWAGIGNESDIEDDSIGPTYVSTKKSAGRPVVDWKNKHWVAPLNAQKIDPTDGTKKKQLLTPGEWYEMTLPTTSFNYQSDGIWPELHLYWGKDSRSQRPNDADNPVSDSDLSKMYTYGDIIYPQFKPATGLSAPVIKFEAQSPYLYFAATKTARGIDEWSPVGEAYVVVTRSASDKIGPAYYADGNRNQSYRDFIDPTEPKWIEPLQSVKFGVGNNQTFVKKRRYTISVTPQCKANYTLLFTTSDTGIKPKTHSNTPGNGSITAANMFKSNIYHDIGITLKKSTAGTGEIYTFYAPGPHLILCAHNADPMEGTNEKRTFENWSPYGEKGEIGTHGSSGSQDEIVIREENTENVYGPVFPAYFDGGRRDLNRYNSKAPYIIKDGQVDFNNRFFNKQIDSRSLITSTSAGKRLTVGKRYKIKITKEFEPFKLEGTYTINWLTAKASKTPADTLGKISSVDQKSYGKYYEIGPEIKFNGPNKESEEVEFEALGEYFVLGFTKSGTDGGGVSLPVPVPDYGWSPNGVPINYELSNAGPTLEGPLYLSTQEHSYDDFYFPELTSGHFEIPFNTLSPVVGRFEEGKEYVIKANPTFAGDRNRYVLVFWWVNDNGLVGKEKPGASYIPDQYEAGIQNIVDTNDVLKGEGGTIFCEERHLVIGVVRDYSYTNDEWNNIELDDWSTKGHPDNFGLIFEEKVQEVEELEGPAYFSDDRIDKLPVLHDPHWEEPINYVGRLRVNGALKDITKGKQYTIKSNSNLDKKLSLVFAKNSRALAPKQNNLLGTAGSLYDTGDIINTYITLDSSNTEHTFYAPSKYMIFGAHNVPDNEDGTPRTLENWSKKGEPAGANLDEYDSTNLIDEDPPYTIIEEDTPKVEGPLYHADYKGGTIDLTPGSAIPTILKKGQINFYHPHWIHRFRVFEFAETEEGLYSKYEVGAKLRITVGRNSGASPKYAINWIKSASGTAPPENTNHSNYGDNYEVEDLVLEENGVYEVIAKSEKFSIGVYDIPNGSDFEKYSPLSWSPTGAPGDFKIEVLTQIKGPAYYAGPAYGIDQTGVVSWASTHFNSPINEFDSGSTRLVNGRRYRIEYLDPADPNDYTFYWATNAFLNNHTNDSNLPLPSIMPRAQRLTVLNRSYPNGVVIECRGDNLIFGQIPADSSLTLETSSPDGYPIQVRVTETTDDLTDDIEIFGPAYFSGRTDHLPEVSNPRFNDPLTVHEFNKPTDPAAGDYVTVEANDNSPIMGRKLVFIRRHEENGQPVFKGRTPSLNNITDADLTNEYYYIDVGVDIPKGNKDKHIFFMPRSTQMIIGAYNNNGSRTINNWSVIGEPATNDYSNEEGGDRTGLVFKKINITDLDVSGEFFWADYGTAKNINRKDPDSNTNLAAYNLTPGTVEFTHEHWRQKLFLERLSGADLLPEDYKERPDGSSFPRRIVAGEKLLFSVPARVNGDFDDQEIGEVEYVINWILDEKQFVTVKNDLEFDKDYRSIYERTIKANTESQYIIKEGQEPVEIEALSTMFVVGVRRANSTSPIGTLYQWNNRGLPRQINVTPSRVVEGPAYLANNDGVVDFANNHWNKPFNEVERVGLSIRPNCVYEATTNKIDGALDFSGLNYSFYFTNKRGLDRSTGVSASDYILAKIPETDFTAILIDKQGGVSGGAVIQFQSPEDSEFKHLIFGAYDSTNPTLPITDWSPNGQPAEIDITFDRNLDEDDTTPRGPGYFGDNDGFASVNDSFDSSPDKPNFNLAHWQTIYHWNNSPQNQITTENPNAVHFKKGESYRLTTLIGPGDPTLHDYYVMGARSDKALVPGTTHDDNFVIYGTLERATNNTNVAYLDLKEIPHEKIVFGAYNVDSTISVTDWSPFGEEVNIDVTDVTNDINKDNNGDYISGPVYWGDSSSNKNPINELGNDYYMSPLNTEEGISEGGRYTLVADNDIDGIYTVVFANEEKGLDNHTNNGAEDFIRSIYIKAGERKNVYAHTDNMLYVQTDVLYKNKVTHHSKDGEPSGIKILRYDDNLFPRKGPVYRADDDLKDDYGQYSRIVNYNNPWWEKPINYVDKLLNKGSVYDVEVTSAVFDQFKKDFGENVKIKIWYSTTAASIDPGGYEIDDTFVTENEVIDKNNLSLKVTAKNERMYLSAFNSNVTSDEEWSSSGVEFAMTITEDTDSEVRGPVYFLSDKTENQGGANQNVKFSDPHWEEVNHYSNIYDLNLVAGEYYRFSPIRAGEDKLEYEVKILGARTDAALKLGSAFVDDFIEYGTTSTDADYIDVKAEEFTSNRVIFGAIGVSDRVLEEWSPFGEPINMKVEKLDVSKDNEGPGGGETFIFGPTYFYSNLSNKPYFNNTRWINDLNHFSVPTANTEYTLTGQATLSGQLSVWCVSDPSHLDMAKSSNYAKITRVTDELIEAGKTIKIKPTGKYLIFGANRPGASTATWNRDGEPAEVTIGTPEISDEYGPAYLNTGNDKNNGNALNFPNFDSGHYDAPLNCIKLVRNKTYKITAKPGGIPNNYKYNLYLVSDGFIANPSHPMPIYIRDVLTSTQSVTFEITGTDTNLIFGAFNTERNETEEWSTRGEPIGVDVEDLSDENSDRVEGSAYWGADDFTREVTDFSDPHWEEIFHYNQSRNNLVKFTRNNSFLITATGRTSYDVYGAKDGFALMVGSNHRSNFHYYGRLDGKDVSPQGGTLVIEEIQFEKIIFCALNQNDPLESWSNRGSEPDIRVETYDSPTDENGGRHAGPVYWTDNKSQFGMDQDYDRPLNYSTSNLQAAYMTLRGTDYDEVRIWFINEPTHINKSPNTINTTHFTRGPILKKNVKTTVAIEYSQWLYQVDGRFVNANGDVVDGPLSWGKDGRDIDVLVEEYEYQIKNQGYCYWGDVTTGNTHIPPFQDTHWRTPLKKHEKTFTKDKYYDMSMVMSSSYKHDVRLCWTDDRNVTNPDYNNEYQMSEEYFKKTNLGYQEIRVKALGRYLQLSGTNVDNNVDYKELKYWNPGGHLVTVTPTEVSVLEGPVYHADEIQVRPNGLPDFKNNHYWRDWRFVDVDRNVEYEVGPPRGEKAEYKYYIWECDRPDLHTINDSSFNLVTTISKNSIKPSFATFTKRYVVIGATETGRNLSSWSPLGEPENLNFTRNLAKTSGISYYADPNNTVGNIANGNDSHRVDRDMLWSDPYWRQAGTKNFNVQGDRFGLRLNTNKEYNLSIKNKKGAAQQKYVYTVWNITEENKKADVFHNGTKTGRPGCHSLGNVTRNKSKTGVNNHIIFHPIHAWVVLAAFDFGSDFRTLRNWSPRGERVQLKIRETGDKLTDEIWEALEEIPYLGEVLLAIEKILQILSIAFLLVGKFKPEETLVEFWQSGSELNDIKMLPQSARYMWGYGSDENENWSSWENDTSSRMSYSKRNSQSRFFNLHADPMNRFIIRWTECRNNGFMAVFRNISGTKGLGTGSTHWYSVLGISNVAKTYAHGPVRMFNPGARIVQYHTNWDADEHTHTNHPSKHNAYIVRPRLINTHKNEDTERSYYSKSNTKPWFGISVYRMIHAAYGGEHYIFDTVDKESKRNYCLVNFAENNSDGNSKKQKNVLGSASGVFVSGDFIDGRPWATDLFNDKGMIAYINNKGKKSSDNRSFVFHIGVESLPPSNEDTKEGITFWPGSAGLEESSFYPGVEFDFSHVDFAQHNSGKEITADFQLNKFICLFRNPYDVMHLDMVLGNHWDATTVPGFPVKFYPSTDTKYLMRDMTAVTGRNDKYAQHEYGKNIHMKLWGTRKITNEDFLSDIYYIIDQGTVNTKKYYYPWKISNLRPLTSLTKPDVIRNIDDYNYYHNNEGT